MTTLITSDEVRTICLPNRTFDVAKFVPHLYPAELQYIKPFLGEALYNEVRAQYIIDDLSANNTILVNEYLKNACAWYVFGTAMPFLHTEIRSGGFFVNNSEYSTGATTSQRAELFDSAIKNAESYIALSKTYLENNSNLFPLYKQGNSIDNQVNIIGGIVFDVTEEEQRDAFRRNNIHYLNNSNNE